MRVGFTGAQGTGKTTLLKAVEKADLGFTVVPSTARAALAAGFKVNRDADMLSQLVTTVSRVALEDQLYRETEKTISDRTPLDSLAYTAFQANIVWQSEYQDIHYYWEISAGLVQEHMYKYDYVIYFPVYWPPKADGVRDDDEKYQAEVDYLIRTLLDTFNIPFKVVPKASTQERLAWLTKTLNL